jgi:PAS domain S-box-containing protein
MEHRTVAANYSPEELYRFQVRQLEEYGMFMIDLSGILLSWNVGVERLFGYSEQEWVGQHGSLIFTPPEKAADIFETEMQNAREYGFSTDIRWHLKKDKQEFFANGFMNAVKNEKGEVIAYAKIVSDETGRKHLQDSLTESKSALEQFAYMASHDLREPLRTMSSFSELLKRQYSGALDERADQYLSFIVDAAARMESLVEDLLSYAENATEIEQPVSVALDEDLETALTNLSKSITDSGAIVTHDALPSLPVDRGRMVRMFQNLVGNALKYRKPDEAPRVHVSAGRQGAEWLFCVRDNGIGFEPEHAAAIFAPFKRLHASREYPGTGIGLAICSRIVKAHGGRIWAEAEPGKGATFFFTVPVQPGEFSKYG